METQIFELLKQGYSFEEIQENYHLSNQEMAVFLSNINKDISKHYNHIKYYENGKRGYSSKEQNERGVITYKDSDCYKSIFISDTHFGSNRENVGYIDKVYDYCIQNDIHNIYHVGDLVDGTTGYSGDKALNPKEQINHVIKDYPRDNNIINFILLGNHDLDTINEDTTLHDAIIKYRKDMCCLGYGTKNFFIKNDFFVLKHSILIDKSDNNYNGKLIIKGHSHYMKMVDDLNNHYIYVPSLSNLQFVNGTIPGFLSIEYGFYNGYINECLVTHYGLIDNNLVNMNSIKINLKSRRKDKDIEREEAYIKIKK